MNFYLFVVVSFSMGFTVYRTGELNTNDRIISFYKKELRSSHIIDKAKKQVFYGTKWYRKFVEYKFPGARRYQRIKAIVSKTYRDTKKKYNTLSQLGKMI